MAGIKKTQKDEGKAQKSNDFLYALLVAIIASKKYDVILPFVFPLLENSVPSNFIIGGFSLVYADASHTIRRHYGDVKKWIEFDFVPPKESIPFDENTIDPVVRKRINEWIEDIFAVISHDPSSILTDKFLKLLSSKTKRDCSEFIAEILTFFLSSINIEIEKNKSILYADFILGEVQKKLKGLDIERF